MKHNDGQLLRFILVGVVALLSTIVNAAQPPLSASLKLEEATYSGIYKHAITLKEGRWTGKPFITGGASQPRVNIVENFFLAGDLDGETGVEYVVILREHSGGSATQNYLAVMRQQAGKLINISTVFIGDRIQLQGGRIFNRQIKIETIQHGAGEPACCPTQKMTQTWRLDGNVLKQEGLELKGTLSLSDLEGVVWVLLRIKRGKNLSAQPEITLQFENENISGKSSCNHYFAGVKESVDVVGNILISPVGSTKMACPKEALAREYRYFEALEGVVQYEFLGDKLVLRWRKNGVDGSMLFASRKRE